MIQVTEPSTRLQVRLIGQFEVASDGQDVGLGGGKQRLLLVVLVCRANRTVPVEELIDTLWGSAPPRTARKNLQVYVSQLRKIVGDALAHSVQGYRLSLEEDECDAIRFEQLVRRGRRAMVAGDLDMAADLFGECVRLWQDGTPAEFGHVPQVADELDRLTELYVDMFEDWAELQITLDPPAEVVERLGELCRRHPMRERLAAARMHMLARCGRIGEALAHYESVRQRLARELGIEPSPLLSGIYRSLLDGRVPEPAPGWSSGSLVGVGARRSWS